MNPTWCCLTSASPKPSDRGSCNRRAGVTLCTSVGPSTNDSGGTSDRPRKPGAPPTAPHRGRLSPLLNDGVIGGVVPRADGCLSAGRHRRRGDGRMFIPSAPSVCQQHADRGDVQGDREGHQVGREECHRPMGEHRHRWVGMHHGEGLGCQEPGSHRADKIEKAKHRPRNGILIEP